MDYIFPILLLDISIKYDLFNFIFIITFNNNKIIVLKYNRKIVTTEEN